MLQFDFDFTQNQCLQFHCPVGKKMKAAGLFLFYFITIVNSIVVLNNNDVPMTSQQTTTFRSFPEPRKYVINPKEISGAGGSIDSSKRKLGRERMLHFNSEIQDDFQAQLLEEEEEKDGLSPTTASGNLDEEFKSKYPSLDKSKRTHEKLLRNPNSQIKEQSEEDSRLEIRHSSNLSSIILESNYSMTSPSPSLDRTTGQFNSNKVTSDEFTNPIIETSYLSSGDEKNSGMIENTTLEKNSWTSLDRIHEIESTPSPLESTKFNTIFNLKDILMNKTKDCKETQFPRPTPPTRFESSVTRGIEKKNEKTDNRKTVVVTSVKKVKPFSTSPPLLPSMSPYSTLFKSSTGTSVAMTNFEAPLVTVVGIFLVSILSFMVWMSHGVNQYKIPTRIFNPVQRSWDDAFGDGGRNGGGGFPTFHHQSQSHFVFPQSRQRFSSYY